MNREEKAETCIRGIHRSSDDKPDRQTEYHGTYMHSWMKGRGTEAETQVCRETS